MAEPERLETESALAELQAVVALRFGRQRAGELEPSLRQLAAARARIAAYPLDPLVQPWQPADSQQVRGPRGLRV